jgi:phosphatidylglycerol---prolipoprotein diacylglyceryl transferase
MVSFIPSRTVAFDVLGFSVHWYGLLYLVAFFVALALLPRLQRYRSLFYAYEEWVDLLTWAIFGVIVGGRLGYVLFYDFAYFLSSPLKVFAVWEGGMSSHGGFIGVVLVLLVTQKKRWKDRYRIADIAVIPTALGFAIGRLGNLINQELYGIATSLPWGITVPHTEGLVHPWPAYASVANFCISIVCFWHLKNPRTRPGHTCALFCMLYATARFFLEYLKEQTYSSVDILGVLLSRGQVLTIGIFVVGAWVWQKTEGKSNVEC